MLHILRALSPFLVYLCLGITRFPDDGLDVMCDVLNGHLTQLCSHLFYLFSLFLVLLSLFSLSCTVLYCMQPSRPAWSFTDICTRWMDDNTMAELPFVHVQSLAFSALDCINRMVCLPLWLTELVHCLIANRLFLDACIEPMFLMFVDDDGDNDDDGNACLYRKTKAPDSGKQPYCCRSSSWTSESNTCP